MLAGIVVTFLLPAGQEWWHGYTAPVCRQALQGQLCPLSLTALPPKFARWT